MTFFLRKTSIMLTAYIHVAGKKNNSIFLKMVSHVTENAKQGPFYVSFAETRPKGAIHCTTVLHIFGLHKLI